MARHLRSGRPVRALWAYKLAARNLRALSGAAALEIVMMIILTLILALYYLDLQARPADLRAGSAPATHA